MNKGLFPSSDVLLTVIDMMADGGYGAVGERIYYDVFQFSSL